MVVVTISSPIDWYKQMDWLQDQCPDCEDLTNWSMWQIGLDNIYILVDIEVAVMFKLRFGGTNNES